MKFEEKTLTLTVKPVSYKTADGIHIKSGNSNFIMFKHPEKDAIYITDRISPDSRGIATVDAVDVYDHLLAYFQFAKNAETPKTPEVSENKADIPSLDFSEV